MTDDPNDGNDPNGSRPDGNDSKMSEMDSQIAAIKRLIDAGETEKAYKGLRDLYNLHPEHSEVCFLWGAYYVRTKDLRQAVDWFTKAVALDPRSPRCHEALIDAYLNSDRTEEAVKALLAATRDSSKPLPFYRWLENLYVKREDTAGVSTLVAEIKSRYAGQPELPYILGEAAFAITLHATAIDFFRQCCDRNFLGESLESYLGASMAYCGYSDYALSFFRAALRRNRQDKAALDGLYELLLWRLKTGNEKLLAAVEWQRSAATKRLGALVQLDYLGISSQEHSRIFEGWLKETITPPDPYTCFCEFYKDLLQKKPDFSSNWFNPADSLLACVTRLTLRKDDLQATYYKGWHTLLTGDSEAAREIFGALVGKKSIPGWIKVGCEGALEEIQEATEADTEAVEAEPKATVSKPQSAESKAESVRRSALEALEAFGADLSELIRKRIISPVAGLGDTVTKICEALVSGAGRGVVLVGPSGVGKTAAIRQLAHFLKSAEAPAALKGFSVFQTSTTRLVSGAKFIGTWQKNIEQLCVHASAKNGIIVYFEDLPNILGAGITIGDPSSFVDFLMPRLELKEILLLGEMESSQAQAVYDRDPRFARLMQEIHMGEPPKERVLHIIEPFAKLEGAKTGVQFTPESLSEVIELSSTFMPYRAFPGKAAEIVYSAITQFGKVGRTEPLKISSEDIVLTFCDLTGIPAALIDRKQLLDQAALRRFFDDRILGQQEAVSVLTAAISTFKGRMCDPRKPLRSFLFVGPTGVGKTEAAKVLAEYVFGSRERLVHVNMSEYSDGSTGVSRLIGSHWTDKKTSRFVDAIRSQPFSVVLLDEIEKASSEVRNLLLQILDESTLLDGDGKPVRFQSTYIIMTSNIGSRRYTTRAIGFGSDAVVQEAQEGVLSDIRDFFSPEIFNRFDEVICFKPLTREVLGTIINREIGKVLERRGVVTGNLSIDIDPLVKDHIVETGFDAKYGARHIKRAVERCVAMPLASLLASQAIEYNSQIRIVMAHGVPIATCVVDDFAESVPTATLRILRSPAFESRVENKELGKFMVSAEERVRGLKSLMKVDEARHEQEQLQGQMTTPTFWDDHVRANQILKRIAELTRIGERVGRWNHVLEQVRSIIESTNGRRRREEVTQAKETLIGLLKDIESAELEMLLEGRNDSADAFIILSCEGASKPEIGWLLDLADMYTGWSSRRGYRCTVVGEQPDGRGMGPSILLHVCGMNAFGLLKNERGVHRRAVVRKVGTRDHPGTRQVSSRLDCRVQVLADLQNSSEMGLSCALKITRIPEPRRGWRLRQLSRKVQLQNRDSGLRLEFLTDALMERDKELPLDLFLSYSYCITNARPTAGAQQRQLGTLVRTYEAGDRKRILDHATKSTVHDSESFLHGNIDSILLERLV